jgi:hypothetical protein
MANPLYTTDVLPTTSVAALREFDDRYIASIGAAPAPTWSDMGDLIPTNAPMVTFPISALSLKYQQFSGENRFKSLLEKSFDLKAQEFDTGIEGKLLDILSKTFAYRNWLQGPARMLIAEGRFRNRSIAALLEAGTSTNWVDGVPFFSAAHPSDLSNGSNGTWSNYQSTPKDVISIPNIAAEVTLMQGALDENGEKVGTEPDTILVPTAKYEGTKNLLAQALILGGPTTATSNGAINNPYLGRFNVVHVPELTDVDDWYLVDSKLLASTGLAPWISMRYTVPSPALELREFGEESDFFKNTGKIAKSSHIWYGFSLGFPHAIRLVRGA